MSQLHKTIVAALLGIALLAGVGVYIATRAPQIGYGPMLTSLDGSPRRAGGVSRQASVSQFLGHLVPTLST